MAMPLAAAVGPDALLEQASAAFRNKQYGQAATLLQRVLAARPDDALAYDFLGTVCFLEGNPEAALRYWNRIGRPVLSQVVAPRVEQSFPFASGDVLRLEDLRTAEARLTLLGVSGRLRLEAQADGTFVLRLVGTGPAGGGGRWLTMARLARGIAYESVFPEYRGESGTTVTSLLRWDADKRRATAEIAREFGLRSQYAWRVGVDGRDERWELPGAGSGDLFRLQRAALRAGVEGVPDGTWRWRTDAEWSYRRVGGLAGYQLKQGLGVERTLWRAPEQRFDSTWRSTAELGRLWMDGSSLFVRLRTGVRAQWYPQRRGDTYVLRMRAGIGTIRGRVPFDELYQLGIERDNEVDLWMRGHAGTRQGRKGSAPLGRSYGVSGVELDRKVYSNGLVGIWLSPFLDTGRMAASGSGWLVDAGVQMKLQVLGVGVTLSYGRDLRAGRNVFYAWSAAGVVK